MLPAVSQCARAMALVIASIAVSSVVVLAKKKGKLGQPKREKSARVLFLGLASSFVVKKEEGGGGKVLSHTHKSKLLVEASALFSAFRCTRTQNSQILSGREIVPCFLL